MPKLPKDIVDIVLSDEYRSGQMAVVTWDTASESHRSAIWPLL
jgi:hypothetical protein